MISSKKKKNLGKLFARFNERQKIKIPEKSFEIQKGKR